MAAEGLHAVNNLTDVVGATGLVHLIYIYRVDGVELQDIVVHAHQGVVHLLTVDHGGIAQHGNLRLRTVAVAQADGVVDDCRKMRVTGRLAVAGEGQHIRQLALGRHLLEFLLQLLGHQLAGGTGQTGTMVFVQPALAIDAVERTDLTIGRHEVDA